MSRTEASGIVDMNFRQRSFSACASTTSQPVKHAVGEGYLELSIVFNVMVAQVELRDISEFINGSKYTFVK